MRAYKDFRPTAMDAQGLGCDDKQEWLVAPVSQTRDSGPLDRSNFRSALKCFAALDSAGNDYEVHRFGHWGPGWFEIILVRPDSLCAHEAEGIEGALADYPVLCDMDHSELEQSEANETWANCYTTQRRIDYVRKHRSQFEFHSLEDMLACCRGLYFAGYASELLQ